jgi:hypothetical protein
VSRAKRHEPITTAKGAFIEQHVRRQAEWNELTDFAILT